ncbi:MAG: lipocalin-like domain-containing protein [Candidatus Binatia bacterium]
MKRVTLGAIGLSALIIGVAFLTEEAAAQMGEDLVGSWTLISLTNEKDDQKVEPYGPNPKGSFMLDGKRFSIVVVRPGRPKFASKSRLTGTPEENKETVLGSIAYFGTYSVSETDSTLVTLHIEGSSFPNWEGAEQKRILTVDGDEMKFVNPTISTGAGTARLVWKRAE